MPHDRIARVALVIGTVFVVAAVAFALRTGPDTGATEPAATAPTLAERGAAHFDQRCARCHERDDLATWARAHPDHQERGQWLAEVLRAHATPPLNERQAIIDHIQQSIANDGR